MRVGGNWGGGYSKLALNRVRQQAREPLERVHDGRLVLRFLSGWAPEGFFFTIPGMSCFTVDERTIVFSASNRREFCLLVGLWQRRLRVTFDLQRSVETEHL